MAEIRDWQVSHLSGGSTLSASAALQGLEGKMFKKMMWKNGVSREVEHMIPRFLAPLFVHTCQQ